MIQFFAGFICGGCTMFGLFLWFFVKDTPRACAYPGCTTNHWNLEKYCSHHILDEYEEEHGRGERPGR